MHWREHDAAFDRLLHFGTSCLQVAKWLIFSMVVEIGCHTLWGTLRFSETLFKKGFCVLVLFMVNALCFRRAQWHNEQLRIAVERRDRGDDGGD